MKNKSSLLTVLLLIAAIGVGFLAGRLTAPDDGGSPQPVDEEEEATLGETRGSGYKYISPLWECDNFHPSKRFMTGMEDELTSYIEQVKSEGKAVYVSVYFRDLNQGPWMGIHERDNYSPASLLKVPILIAGLKKAEQEPGFLSKKIQFTVKRENNVNPNIVDKNLLKMGEWYTIEDLMNRMIEYSDNEAKELLVVNIGDPIMNTVLKDLGINIQGVRPGDDFVSVKDYSSFFRVLYNATYLSKDMSEKALEILSKTTFAKGIVAGVPQGTIVAHKFGERAFDNSDIKQLHDCGIVYTGKSPYLLCVMTRGNDFEKLSTVLAGVSSIVYKKATEKNQ